VVVSLLFPLAGMIADFRREGAIHPAWGWGVATVIGSVVLTEAITYSAVGEGLYQAVVAGSPAAAIAPLAFPAPPGPPPA